MEEAGPRPAAQQSEAKKQCPYKYQYAHEECPHEAEPGGELCIFHLPPLPAVERGCAGAEHRKL
ncbi:MAG: hypothetical protein ABIK62_00825 [candidate division WOR-3 bacterium]